MVDDRGAELSTSEILVMIEETPITQFGSQNLKMVLFMLPN